MLSSSIYARTRTHAPAPIVSPPRLIRILPISLFTEKGSIGIGKALDAGPEYTDPRKMISTSADIFFVSTLGLLLITLPLERSRTDIRRDIDAGTSREWWKSSIYTVTQPHAHGIIKHSTHRGPCSNGNLDIKDYDSRSKRGSQGYDGPRTAEDAANVQRYRVHTGEGEVDIRPRACPWETLAIVVDH